MLLRLVKCFDKIITDGPVRESNPGPLAPEARIMPLDQLANNVLIQFIRRQLFMHLSLSVWLVR